MLLKRTLLIILLIAGLHFSSNAQVKPTFAGNDAVKTVKYFPNPAISFINFEFEKNYNNYKLEIFNFIGKKVSELKVSDQKITIPLTDYFRGVYIFQLRDQQGNIVESGKFQVVK